MSEIRIPMRAEELQRMQDDNERMATQIDDIAAALGCPEKTSHRHSHGRCIFAAIDALQSQPTPPSSPERVPFVNDGTKPCSACGDGDTDKKYHVHVSGRGWLKPIVEAAQRDVETWPEWQRKGIQEAANASPEQEARAWRLAHINEFRTMHHNTFGGGGMITDYDGMLAAYAAHIRQQQKEQDARIAKTYADGGCSGDAIAAAIRSQN